MRFEKITESSSNYIHLEKMKVLEILSNLNAEDQKVPQAIAGALADIEKLVVTVAEKLRHGGRLFYIGAGTSGRLGIVDASECPTTFGTPPKLVTGIIAGGKKAITEAVEFAEDDTKQGWSDLSAHKVSFRDFVIGISASGSTAYTLNALGSCKEHGISTGSISCNPGSPLSSVADYPIEIVVGPEFVTGSTRLKAGTAQKLVLNMISTAVMILLGKVEDNKMVNMQLTNNKLIERGIKMVMEQLALTDSEMCRKLLMQYGSVKNVLDNYRQ